MNEDQKEQKPRVLTWKSPDPAWSYYAVAEPNMDTRWFKTYEEASKDADKAAKRIKGVVIAK